VNVYIGIVIVIGVVAFALGMVTMKLIMRARGSSGDRTPPTDDPRPTPVTPPTVDPPPDDVGLTAAAADHIAAYLFEESKQLESPIPPEKLRSILEQLDRRLIAPEEEEPVDPQRHDVQGTISTADRTRHGTVADLRSPGLEDRTGRVITKAAIYRYEYAAGNPDPHAPSRTAATIPDRQVPQPSA
jgi:hypothetical protein